MLVAPHIINRIPSLPPVYLCMHAEEIEIISRFLPMTCKRKISGSDKPETENIIMLCILDQKRSTLSNLLLPGFQAEGCVHHLVSAALENLDSVPLQQHLVAPVIFNISNLHI